MKDSRETVEAFLQAWGREDWEAAADLIQESWADTVTDVPATLEGVLGSRVPAAAAIDGEPTVHSHILTEWVILLDGKRHKCMCILEHRWGVNPISTFRPVD